MRNTLIILFLLLFSMGLVGCETTGYVAGQTVEETKEIPEEMEEGYEEGKADAAED